MVIGSGMLASAFKNFESNDEVILFASGVSNSLESDPEKFLREESLLTTILLKYPEKKLVYFSTYSILYKQSTYTEHKKNMEELVLRHNYSALVLRVTNVVGKSSNPNTLLNFLTYRIRQKLPITILSGVKRNLIGIDDLYTVVSALVNSASLFGSVLHIGYPHSYSIEQIVKKVEEFYNTNASITLAPAYENWQENYFDISPLEGVSILDENKYLSYLLNTYYK